MCFSLVYELITLILNKGFLNMLNLALFVSVTLVVMIYSAAFIK